MVALGQREVEWINLEVIVFSNTENERDNKNNPLRKQDKVQTQVKLGLLSEWHSVYKREKSKNCGNKNIIGCHGLVSQEKGM